MEENRNNAAPDNASDQSASTTAKDAAETAAVPAKRPNATLTQVAAALADRQAQIQSKIRKKITRGIILAGAALIKAAANDAYLKTFLRKLIVDAEPRNKEALELATTALFNAGE